MLQTATAQDLALAIALRFEEAGDAEALAPLVDAALVWLDDASREPIARSVVETLWPRQLREDIEAALDVVAKRSRHVRRAAARARRDLAAGPAKSRLAVAVVEQAAGERAFDLQLQVGCMHCVDEGIARDPEKRLDGALTVARMAGHAAAIAEQELREALEDGAAAVTVATDERRAEVRWWLRRIALLGQRSIPHLSAALFELLDEPLPAAEHDEVWREAIDGLERRLALHLR
jgi:hypothetical protein